MRYDITITTKELCNDIRFKTRLETAGIEDAEARYRAEIGTEKADELTRNIQHANGAIRNVLGRFLMPDEPDEVTLDEFGLPTSFTYSFDLSERRAGNKAVPLTEAIHSYLVHMSLATSYASVGQVQLYAQHSEQAAGQAALALEIINRKTIPNFTD